MGLRLGLGLGSGLGLGFCAWKKVRVTAEKRSTGCANEVAPIKMTSEQ